MPADHTLVKFSGSKPGSAGFTLIELLVVTAITVILMVAISAFFLTFIVGNTKAVFEQKLKRDGEQAMAVMSQMLRNGHGLTSTCTTGLNSISFRGEDDLLTTFTGGNGRVASLSAITDPVTTFYLTSDFSQLTPADTITFNCYQTNEQIYIEVTFALRRGASSTNDQSSLTREFSSGFNLRN